VIAYVQQPTLEIVGAAQAAVGVGAAAQEGLGSGRD
jgi:hypothetical protein